MIQTKSDLKFYMTEDERALGYDKLPFSSDLLGFFLTNA